jgi:ribosomal 50S subunit-recycling heat shock protein
MRIDKFLQVSRIIKRRSVAKEMIVNDRVMINNKIAKPASEIKIDDEIRLEFGRTNLIVKVKKIEEKVNKDNANELFDIILKEDNNNG